MHMHRWAHKGFCQEYPYTHFVVSIQMIIDREGDNVLGSVRPSVSRLDCLTYDLDIWYVG